MGGDNGWIDARFETWRRVGISARVSGLRLGEFREAVYSLPRDSDGIVENPVERGLILGYKPPA